MKIATEKREDWWLAQVVHVGDNMSGGEHQRIQNEVHKWVTSNKLECDIYGWQFYFGNEKDLTLFLLRWS